MITNGPIEYLIRFANGNLQDYQYALMEFKTQNGYGDFRNYEKIRQCMVDLTLNIKNKLLDIRIPETYESDKALIEYITELRNHLESLDGIFLETIEDYENSEMIPVPVLEINSRRKKLINVLIEFLERVEHINEKENSTDQAFDLGKIKNITVRKLFFYLKKLTIGSIIFIFSILSSLVVLTYTLTPFINKLRFPEDNNPVNYEKIKIHFDYEFESTIKNRTELLNNWLFSISDDSLPFKEIYISDSEFITNKEYRLLIPIPEEENEIHAILYIGNNDDNNIIEDLIVLNGYKNNLGNGYYIVIPEMSYPHFLLICTSTVKEEGINWNLDKTEHTLEKL